MILFQINSVLNTGSTGRIVENIGVSILNIGGKSFVYYGRGDGNNSKSVYYGPNNRFSFLTHVLKTRISDSHAFGSSVSTKKLIFLLKQLKPDIIHLHNIHGYYLNIKLLFKYLSSIDTPIVWTLHDCWSFTGHCAHFENVNCYKWKKLCCDCPQIHEYPKSWFIDRSRQNFIEKKELFTSVKNLTLVPVSNWLKAYLTESFLSNFPIRVINNGIDLSVFNIKEEKVFDCSRPIILGVTSVWSREKGLFDLIKLSEQLSVRYQIVLVGLNKKQIKSLPSNILGIERTESIEELANYYSQALAYINPTYGDTFPTTNLEALACGTPVITYNTGGSPEAIDGNTGYVVEKGDIGGLIEKIELISEKGKHFYQAKCRERAERLFNKDDRYSDYIELYKEILNKDNVTI